MYNDSDTSLLFEIHKKISVFNQKMKESCLEYKVVGIRMHPETHRYIVAREAEAYYMASSISELSKILGHDVVDDYSIPKSKFKLIIEDD